MAVTGTPGIISFISPKFEKDGFTCGKELIGISNFSSKALHHSISYKSYRRVLDAFVTSV